MRLARGFWGIGLGTLAVAGLFAASGLHAQDSRVQRIAKRQTADIPGRIGVFTPAAADPKLAAVLARSGLPMSDFRFTPSESRRAPSKAASFGSAAAGVNVPNPPAFPDTCRLATFAARFSCAWIAGATKRPATASVPSPIPVIQRAKRIFILSMWRRVP